MVAVGGAQIKIPKRGKIYSMNEANRWDWDKPLQERHSISIFSLLISLSLILIIHFSLISFSLLISLTSH